MTSKNKQTHRTHVRTRRVLLTPLEEKVVRMRYGLGAPASLPLEQVGQDHPETAAKLKAIEERALKAVGARSTAAKRKIVSALRRKQR